MKYLLIFLVFVSLVVAMATVNYQARAADENSNLPRLVVPKSHSCPKDQINETVFIDGLGEGQTVRGQLIVEFIHPDQSRTIYKTIPVNESGPKARITIQVPEPPGNTWPITVLAENLRELHVDIQLFVYEGNKVVGTLGPGQDWDVNCIIPPPTPPPCDNETHPCPTPTPTPTPPPCDESPCPTPTPIPTPTSGPGGGGGGGGVGGSVCNDTKPATVTLLSATKTNPTTAQLKWSKVSGVNNYNIQYGLSSHNYTFGVPQTGDVDNFTIGNLDTNANYCFVVRSINGCQLSDLSNEICLSGQVLGVSAKRGEVLGASTLAATGNFEQTVGLIFQILGVISITSGGFFLVQKKIL